MTLWQQSLEARLLAHWHVFNTWYYRVSLDNAQCFYSKINSGQREKSTENRQEKHNGEKCC